MTKKSSHTGCFLSPLVLRQIFDRLISSAAQGIEDFRLGIRDFEQITAFGGLQSLRHNDVTICEILVQSCQEIIQFLSDSHIYLL